MPTITRTIKVKSGADGTFRTEEVINPPGFWNYSIKASATLLTPEDTTIVGRLDITAANGKTVNPPKDFHISTGETGDLGGWKLDGGDNSIIVEGKTEPPRANSEIEIEVTVKI